MDANKPVSPRDVGVGATQEPDRNFAITTVGERERASPPRLYAGNNAAPSFIAGSAPVAHAGTRASMPHWEDIASSVVSPQEESGTASSSDQAATGVADPSQNNHVTTASSEQLRRDKVKEKYLLTAEEVIVYENLEASIKAGDRSSVVRGFTALDSRKTLSRLLAYTNYTVMVDAIKTGDAHLLEFIFDEANDSNFRKKRYDRMTNCSGDAGGETLLDIAASRTDLKIGLMLVEKGAKPGLNCPRQFLDSLLELAIASTLKNAIRNLLGYGADWNLFFYSEKRHQFDFVSSEGFLIPASHFHQHAKNQQALLDIACLWAGSDSNNSEKFDHEIERCASDANHYRVKKLLKLRSQVVEADRSKPTAAMMRAIQVAAAVGTAATLKILLDEMSDSLSLSSQILDMKDPTGRTLLHLAARSGDEKKVALLLNRGANLREKDGQGDWSLVNAIKGNHISAAVLLLQTALAATDNWPRKKEMIRAAVGHASPAMRVALMNAHAEVQPGPPAKVTSPPPYEPHEAF